MNHVRNFGIIALLALGIVALPGGDTAANLFQGVLLVVVTIGAGLVGAKYYLENRTTLHSLGDPDRALLYGGIGVLVVALAGGAKLNDTGPGTLLYVVLIAAGIAAIVAVVMRARQY